jgi:plasmid stabilization system protein ParE
VSLRAEYHELARADLYSGWAWYEDRQPELGDRSSAALDAAVLRATRWPKSGSPTRRDDDEVVERRLATPGFPYVIRYRVIGDTLLVIAVSHQHRRPGFGTDRQP